MPETVARAGEADRLPRIGSAAGTERAEEQGPGAGRGVVAGHVDHEIDLARSSP